MLIRVLPTLKNRPCFAAPTTFGVISVSRA